MSKRLRVNWKKAIFLLLMFAISFESTSIVNLKAQTISETANKGVGSIK